MTRAGRSVALVALLLPALAAAGEPDFEAEVRGAFERLRPGVRAAPTIGDRRSFGAPRWLDESTFLGPFGLRVDRSCMAFEGAARVPAKFTAEVLRMDAALQRCASTRVLPATVGLIYERARRARVDCDPKACRYSDKSVHAIACTDSDEGLIHVVKPEGYAASTFAHELMHFTRHVDNQEFVDHAHTENRLRDEIYFWERHCFDQKTLLERMRAELGKRAAAAGLGYETQADLSRVHGLAYEVCALPFRYNVRRKLWANEREIRAVCGQYSEYLMMEINLGRALRGLVAEAGECSKADGAACPRPELYAPGTKERAALASAKLLPPPAPPYSPEAFGAWTEAMCAKNDSREVRGNPTWLLRSCAETLAARAAAPETRASLLAAGVPGADVDALAGYFTALALKARALSSGPGRYNPDIEEDKREETLARALRESAAACAVPALGLNAFCRELAPDAPAPSLLGRLLLFWQPRTLPAR